MTYRLLDESSTMQALHHLFTEPRFDGMTYPDLDGPFVGSVLHQAMLESA